MQSRLVRFLAIAYVSYLALALLVITPALNFLPSRLAGEHLGREFNSEWVWFNPFTISLELRGIDLPERDGTRFFGLRSATANLSLSSLWSGALVFDEVGVDRLFVSVVQLPDGSFNFSDMLPPPDPEAPPAEPGGIPAVTIGQFNFNAERIAFTDAAREQPSSTNLSEITVSIEGLSTVLEEEKPYMLDASGPQGGKLHWEGRVSIPKAYSEGSLVLTDIYLPNLWRFAEPWLAFELTEGGLSVEARYRVDWNEGLDYWISGGEARLDRINIDPKVPDDLPDTGLALGSLRLTGIELDGPEQRVDLDSLAISDLAINGWSEGSQVSLTRLFEVNLPTDTSPQPPAPDEGESVESGWTAQLGNFQLTNSSIRWRSDYTDPAQLDVTPIEFSADSIRWPLAGDTGLELKLTINGQATASVSGSLDLARGAGSLGYQLNGLPLPWFNPNFPDALNARLTDGRIQLGGEISLADYAPVTLGVDGAISNFAGGLTDTEESFTSWETVRWEQLRIDMERRAIELAKLSIDDYKGRLHIKRDGSINAQNIWKQEVGEEAEEVAEALAEGEPWAVGVQLIHISDSEIDFMDESIPIPFRAVIGDLEGDIKDLNTQTDATATVDIRGSIEGYAPVVLAGTANPLGSPPALDLQLTIAGVDMTLLSPYSGTYAGYAIERGVLELDLSYAMQDNRLKGDNRILIKRMKLGEKVSSEKAADLPLKLALALLTDSKGVIDLKVPISGDVSNPDFSVGSVLVGALTNLITKAVTSPFSLLAGLVDSEQDLQRLNFKSGSAELQASAREKLDDLASALAQRPELNLVITGRLQLQVDRERLQKNLLQAELLAAGLPESELASRGPGWEQAIEARYRANTPGDTGLTVREQYLAMAQAMPVPDSDLLELASARAVAVKSHLVNEVGLSADRAVIGKPSLEAKANLYSGAELAIDI